MIAKIETVSVSEFYVAGITIRTSNQNGQSQRDIGALWARFMGEGLIQKIPGRLSDDIYSVYTDYESDHDGAYTVVLGCKVDAPPTLPPDFTCITVRPGKYQVNTVEGDMPVSIMEAWQQIWDTATNRKYTADFEVYDAENGAKIYLAVQ